MTAVAQDLLVRTDDGVRTLELNRPDRGNALTADQLERLADQLVDAGEDPSVRVVVLRGSGRSFCTGADLGTRDAPGTPPSPATVDGVNRVVRTLVHLPRPVVAAVQGPVAGIGVALALAADVVVAQEDAYFLLPFCFVGLMPDGGLTALLPALVGRTTALRLALLGDRVTARQALELGIVSRVGGADEVVEQLARSSLPGLVRTKLAMAPPLDAAFATERAGQLALLSGHDFLEGVTAFESRRQPSFTDLWSAP